MVVESESWVAAWLAQDVFEDGGISVFCGVSFVEGIADWPKFSESNWLVTSPVART